MKRFFLLNILFLTMLSCSIEDDSPKFHYEAVPVENVITPDAFSFGATHDIMVNYYRPTGCHIFNNFLFETNGNEVTVVVMNTVYENQECDVFEPQEESINVSFRFRANISEDYIFKFWQGEDASGNDLYYVVEVPVNNEND